MTFTQQHKTKNKNRTVKEKIYEKEDLLQDYNYMLLYERV